MKLGTTIALLFLSLQVARADSRSQVADSLGKLSVSASSLAKVAKASDDRGARKKFAPAATELADDLGALQRRTTKSAAWKAIAKDAEDLDRAAAALADLADEDEDKTERKSLRAQAQLIEQGIAGVRKQIADAGSKDSDDSAPQKYTGRLLNNSDACSWAENLRFVVSRDGRQVFASQLVFPGKELPLVLEKGRYLVQFFDTSGNKRLGQGTLDADREGWAFKSGCVNQD